MNGCDGHVYSQGTVDFITAQACIMLQNGLRPDQVGLGLPASSRAAGSGYVSPQIVNNALCPDPGHEARQLQAEHHVAVAARCDDLVDQLGRAERQRVQPGRRPSTHCPDVLTMHSYRPAPVLEALGVCSEDEQLYQALARPESTTTDLSRDTGWPANRVGRHLKSLLSRPRLADYGPPGQVRAGCAGGRRRALALRKQAAIVEARLGASVLTRSSADRTRSL